MSSTPRRGGTQASLCEHRPHSTDIRDLDTGVVVSASRSGYQNEPSHAEWLGGHLSPHVPIDGFLWGGRS